MNLKKGNMLLYDKKLQPKKAIILLGAMSLFAFIGMSWITSNGSGISPDSLGYIETSQSLLEGKGFYYLGEPMTHWPPVYPSLLALVGFFQDDKIQVARWLNAFIYAINIFLIGFCAYTFTRRSLLALSCAVLLFMSSETMISIHSMAWTEPLFILFLLSGILLLSIYIVRSKIYALVFASLSIGLAFATRYIGITLFPAVFICILLLGRHSFVNKIRDMLILSFISLAPIAIWMARNALFTDNLTDRSIIFHPITLSDI